jgi:L-asparaginase
MNDAINSARDATKTNTYRTETFRAPELGLLGQIDGDKVSFYHSSTRRHTSRSEFDGGALTSLAKVEIVYSYVESDPAIIDAIVTTGARGIVFAAGGAGVLSSAEKAAVQRIRQLPPELQPVLVLSSRVGNGRVIPRTEYDELGMVPADNLNPQKARVLLMLALTQTKELPEIRRMFAEY